MKIYGLMLLMSAILAASHLIEQRKAAAAKAASVESGAERAPA